MRKLVLGIIAISCMGAIYAQRGKKVKGNGNIVTLERNTGDYEALRIGGFFEVELVGGIEGTIILKGEENILDNIETEVKGGTLTIKPFDNMRLRPSWGEGVTITIPVEQINAIRLSGSGKLVGKKPLKADNFRIRTSGSRNLEVPLDVKSLTVVTSGSSNVRLNGYSKELEVVSSGSSDVKAYELTVDRAKFTASGSSNVKVTVNGSIDAKISGSANVSYQGNPQKEKTKTSGSGKISKK